MEIIDIVPGSAIKVIVALSADQRIIPGSDRHIACLDFFLIGERCVQIAIQPVVTIATWTAPLELDKMC